MVLATAVSKNGVKIRLTQERWNHIITSHIEIDAENFPEVMDVIKDPDIIFKGDSGGLLAVKKIRAKRVWYVVPYKEVNGSDGFVLTAYITTDSRWLFQREAIWNKE